MSDGRLKTPAKNAVVSTGSQRIHAASDGGVRMTDDKPDDPLPRTSGMRQLSPESFPLPPSPFRLCFRALASLQLAVALIAVYAVVLAGATVDREQVWQGHGAAAARFAVYGTGWFTAIHVLLAVNVLCAMLIRFPWRRRQIGFLVTHGGILVLLVGCAATRWAASRPSCRSTRAMQIISPEIDQQDDAANGKGKPLELGLPSLSASVPSPARSRQRNAVTLFEPGRFSRSQQPAEETARRTC